MAHPHEHHAHTHEPPRTRGIAEALLGAALFGASAPLAKLLLPSAPPLLLAGLFYLGAGLSLSVALGLRRRPLASGLDHTTPPAAALAGAEPAAPKPPREVSLEAPLRRADAPLLLALIVLGGALGPVLMLWGLARTSGFAGSLLLNLEAPLTLLLAVTIFGEHLSRREAIAAAIVIAGAALLGLQGEEARGSSTARIDPLGALAIAGACLCWGLDNNLAQRLSLRDPVAIARAKTLGAGSCTLLLALLLGARLPPLLPLLASLVVGALSYGLSIVLDVIALRHLGAAREAAFFATAPFTGALLAMPLLGERPAPVQLTAAALLALGVALLVRARHGHTHRHAPLAHDHQHLHDAHHQHDHAGLPVPRDASGQVLEPHAHLHLHTPLLHDHPHVSDAHHRHEH